MDIKNNQTISKLIESGVNTRSLSGYLYTDDNSSTSKMRVYPRLNTSQCYELEKSSIVEVVQISNRDDRKTVYIRDDSEFYLVTKHSASELEPGNENILLTQRKSKLPAYLDRLSFLLLSDAFLELYLGNESNPGPGQTGKPSDDLS